MSDFSIELTEIGSYYKRFEVVDNTNVLKFPNYSVRVANNTNTPFEKQLDNKLLELKNCWYLREYKAKDDILFNKKIDAISDIFKTLKVKGYEKL